MRKKKKIVAMNAPEIQCPDYKTEIAETIRSNLAPMFMREKILSYHENDIASALELLSAVERGRLYRIIDSDNLANILEYSDEVNEYISELEIKKRIEVISKLEVNIAAEYLRQLDKYQRSMLAELMDDSLKGEIIFLNSFDEDEIGSKMTRNYVSVNARSDVRQAMKELIKQAADNDNISTIYVTDNDETLVGAIDLKDLIIAREDTEFETIIMTTYPYVYANEQISDCIERIKGYSEDSIPVLDSDNRIKGVLTSQTVTRIIDTELGEDYAKLAGLSSEEDLKEPFKKSVCKRLPWLVILLGLGFIVSSVVGIFEDIVAQLTIIMSFQSLVLDMAGNAGTQSLAVTIRVLMDENISGKQKLHLIRKEACVGLANGTALGLLSFICTGLYLMFLKNQTALLAFSVSFCTGIALLIAILLSSIIGTAVPVVLKKLKIDPAVASGPLITTINDLVAVVTYYGLAWIILINVLGL